jgi:hypothetical protein
MAAGSIGSDRLPIPGAVTVERVLRTASDRLRALRCAGEGSAVRRVDPTIVAFTVRGLLRTRSATTASAARAALRIAMPMLLCTGMVAASLAALPVAPWHALVTAGASLATFLLPPSLPRLRAFRWMDAVIAGAGCAAVTVVAGLVVAIGGAPWLLASGLGMLAGGAAMFALAWSAPGAYLERNSLALRTISISAVVGGQALLALAG